MAVRTVQLGVRCVEIKARRAVVETRQGPGLRLLVVAAQAIGLALLSELPQVRIGMAIDAISPGCSFVAAASRGHLLALGVASIALRERVLALQGKAGPKSMIKGPERGGLKTSRFMTARAVAASAHLSRQTFACEDAIMRTGMATHTAARVTWIVIRDETKAAGAFAFSVAARAGGLLMRAVQGKSGPRSMVKGLVQLLKLRDGMTPVTADASTE
jgi:hypothetical protein